MFDCKLLFVNAIIISLVLVTVADRLMCERKFPEHHF